MPVRVGALGRQLGDKGMSGVRLFVAVEGLLGPIGVVAVVVVAGRRAGRRSKQAERNQGGGDE